MRFLRKLFILILIAVCLGGSIYLARKYLQPEQQIKHDTSTPLIISQNITTKLYNSSGVLTYKIKAKELEYYEVQDESHFKSPVFLTFKEGKTATWQLKSNKAVLTKNQILVLSGDVLVSSLTEDIDLKTIYTDYLVVDLITQDFSGDRPVLIHGINFDTEAQSIHGNFKRQAATLENKVKTTYEIK